MLAAAHTPGGFGGVPQSVGLDFMHADQKAGRVGMGREGKAFGGALPNPFPGAHHVETALRIATQPAPREKFADGGYMPPRPGFGEMGDFRSILSPTAGGIITSEVPGRTDHIPTSVASDSYVMPADVVSGLGEGNTLAGARLMQDFLSTGPHGVPLQHGSHGSTIPHPPPAPSEGGRSTTTYSPHFAKGGAAPAVPPIQRAPLKPAHVHGARDAEPKVILAGGEFLIDPHQIAYHPNLGNLSPNDHNPEHYRRAINHGHKVLDAFVVAKRKEIAQEMLKLPGPKKD